MNDNVSSQVTWSLALDARQEGETLQNWLYRALRQDILGGRLPRNHLLPGTRHLAAQYGLARGTVQAAYNQLLSEGYLETAKGSGTRVSLTLPHDHRAQARRAPESTESTDAAPLLPTSRWARELVEQSPAFLLDSQSQSKPFVPHCCDVASFPIDIWRRLHARHLAAVQPTILSRRTAQGSPALRQAIADHLAIARGVAVSAENIVLVSSVQQALDICLRLIIEPGDAVWMEDPGYTGARQILLGARANVVDVPVDELGIVVDEGIRKAPHARLAYVTPCRQAPMGVALSPDRRLTLLQWARDNGAYVFEDDYDSEYRFIAKPIPALKSMPQADHHVILAGTFSKLLFPAIGLAYLALPPQLVEPFTRAMSLTARNANSLAQAVLADFMTEGHFDRHIRKMRKLYAARAKAFESLSRQLWADFIEFTPIHAGLDVAGRLKGFSEPDALALLQNCGIGAFPLSRYTQSVVMPPGLVMGFAAHTEPQIEQKMILVAQALLDSSAPHRN
ncbi:PLP-dependent aminotransferase family protein [Pseudomonas sp. REP124]|uniref:MocR-like pyridoxine biosynthesis transcription factor PdxR n=1 Tax=Pseudomonas sp. REP124 TaxID=2875731 RepID=UPI001CCD2A60|nr:PLP-dependent aminotransferase family protein [Pseudomonas sp. REP124]MBZ9780199.1 PLP-dependent aminotransferase family protein [Pseudomonas sp. REP124]